MLNTDIPNCKVFA